MFTFTSVDGLDVHVHHWPAHGEARGVVQIVHGMGEHAGRYAAFAEALTTYGYAVYANDHRGHGRTMKGEPGRLGPDGWNLLVADVVALTELLCSRHPGLSIVLFGQSMGSYAVQQFLLDHGDLVEGVVLTGTTALDGLLKAMGAAGREDYYNAPFQPVRTGCDWLSRDDAEVDAFIADPLCGFALDENGLRDMYAAAPRLADPSTVPAGLPLCVAVGDRDPLNAGLSLSDLLVERYRAAGLTDITYRAYGGARHELLHETNRDEVQADLVAWITRVIG
ncbi:alpha/beta fold hydrolase [Thermomonospora umbrina]|uniref:Alpha-beta hydrolase superfamily lysophospholipase n=1 Tax=Thermomonospora umbrina TaxID=111806 RepID=A0A3D9SQH3_9ACTN|nr:alpha/beta hydrolase [Thermomonospora umbrina]REE95195.1 alpha-beta hydrolase superfamily lysophospholipase [Thermomonospora umbrina]